MEVGQLYGFVLLIVMVGMLLGIGILLLDKFGATSGISGTAWKSLNDTRDSLATISTDWLPLIITISVLVIVLVLVVRGVGGGQKRM
jgi:hypothetical protein